MSETMPGFQTVWNILYGKRGNSVHDRFRKVGLIIQYLAQVSDMSTHIVRENESTDIEMNFPRPIKYRLAFSFNLITSYPIIVFSPAFLF